MKTAIETERLLLRPLLATDSEPFFVMDSDPRVQRFVGNKPVTEIAQIHGAIKSIQQQYKDFGVGRWAVILKETNEFIGWSGLKFITESINGHKDFYEIGYRFIPKHWGKGYATEAGNAFIDYGFNELNVDAIYAYADKGNSDSHHVLEKLGMQYVNAFHHEGDDEVWYQIENPNKK